MQGGRRAWTRRDDGDEPVHTDTCAPDPALAKAVAATAQAQGVIPLICGTWGNVLRFLPPLSISDDLLCEGLDVIASALAEQAH